VNEKFPNHLAPDYVKATQRHLRYAEARLGRALPPSARILDFGCGIGNSVKLLLVLGYDAYGVDVLEYWDRDLEKYWHAARKPSQLDSMRFNNYPTKRRLRRIAQSAGVQISFAEVDEFLIREGSTAKTAILSALRRVKLDRLATHIAAPFMLQRYMILRAQSARRM
jgi:SAM-dependent methyltransferase